MHYKRIMFEYKVENYLKSIYLFNKFDGGGGDVVNVFVDRKHNC